MTTKDAYDELPHADGGEFLPRSQQRCGNCNAWYRIRSGSKDGLCRAHPPVVTMAMVPDVPTDAILRAPGAQGQVQVRQVANSEFPPMSEVGWCREWQQAHD